MSAEERLIRYCKIDTQSDPDNDSVTPSTKKQFDLAKVLAKELKELGLKNTECDEHCYVYGFLPSNQKNKVQTVGFIAHMDTAPDYSGTNVNPQIIPCFDGKDIKLKDGTVTKMSDFPEMKKLKGKRLIVTDGSTLLGADDKAGITCIMEALAYLKEHPEIKHGNISIGFTPDEEIGNGPKYFDIKKFNADFAYTMDGGSISELSDETFNAASAVLKFKGFSIHPGGAKNRMINAASIASEYHMCLPEHMTPEHTEGREGFIHLIGIKGNTDEAESAYIIRDHDAKKLKAMEELMKKTVAFMNAKYGKDTVSIEIKDTYRNMKEILLKNPAAVRIAEKSMRDLGIEPVSEPVRGGTDGAELSYRGLPCPNLGNGGGNYHGRYEYCAVDELEKAAELVLKVIENTSKGDKA